MTTLLDDELQTFLAAVPQYDTIPDEAARGLLTALRQKLNADIAFISETKPSCDGFRMILTSVSLPIYECQGKVYPLSPRAYSRLNEYYDADNISVTPPPAPSEYSNKATIYYACCLGDINDGCLGLIDMNNRERVWTAEERQALIAQKAIVIEERDEFLRDSSPGYLCELLKDRHLLDKVYRFHHDDDICYFDMRIILLESDAAGVPKTIALGFQNVDKIYREQLAHSDKAAVPAGLPQELSQSLDRLDSLLADFCATTGDDERQAVRKKLVSLSAALRILVGSTDS